MNKLSILALIVAVIALGVTVFAPQSVNQVASQKETVYERVMRTQTIRCGYNVWDPIIIKDLKTGKVSGIFYDYMEALGKELSLKIVWDDSLTWSDWQLGLQNERYDAACVGIWPMAHRAREADFTMPIYYHAMYAYVCADDERFDGDIELANKKSVTFSGQDGTVAQSLAQKRFPQAKLVSLSNLAGQTEPLLYVVTGKADVVISDKITAGSYMEKNLGKLKQVAQISPIAFFGNTVAIKIGEDKFRRMLNTATRELINSGMMDQIISKYEKYPRSLLRVAKPYSSLKE